MRSITLACGLSTTIQLSLSDDHLLYAGAYRMIEGHFYMSLYL